MFSNYFKNLVSLCLDEKDTFQTKYTTQFKCDCSFLMFHNRVIVEGDFELFELEYAKKLHKNNPYTIWVDAKNIEAKNKLNNNDFSVQISWPSMVLALEDLQSIFYDSCITVKRIMSDDEILKIWVPLVIKSYSPQFNLVEFEKAFNDWNIFFNYLHNSVRYSQINFFLGYWENVPVATGVFIIKDDNVFIHWIGVLPEYRNKKLGSVITSIPLQHFKKNGIKNAYLFASVMGKPIYEKLGFTTIGQVDAYKTDR